MKAHESIFFNRYKEKVVTIYSSIKNVKANKPNDKRWTFFSGTDNATVILIGDKGSKMILPLSLDERNYIPESNFRLPWL